MMGKIYLAYGDEPSEIEQKRLQLYAAIVPKGRRENLREFLPATNRFFLNLKSILGELLAELNLEPFPPAQHRLIVVHNVSEFYKAGDKKAVERLLSFLSGGFLGSPNHLLFVCMHDAQRGRFVQRSLPLFQFMEKQFPRQIFYFYVPRLVDELYDAILRCRLPVALQVLNQWWGETQRPASVIDALIKILLLILQAKVTVKSGLPLPGQLRINLDKERARWQKRIQGAASQFSYTTLISALGQLADLYPFLYPRQSDKYVPDLQKRTEVLVSEFLLAAGTSP